MSEICEKYSELFPFWDKLTRDERALICRNTAAVNYKKGRTVHGGGENCTGVIFVTSGVLRAYMLSDEGREITLYRLFAGDICMLSASCVLKSITFDVHVDAEEDTEAYLISPQAFGRIAEENVYAENFAMSVAIERFSDVMWAMQQILFMSLDKRLAIFLLDESSKNGSDEINLSHEQIAKYMGSAREVVSRMLKYFSDEKIVSVTRKEIRIIDKARLKELAYEK